jgi:aldose sugar dehydrogenase
MVKYLVALSLIIVVFCTCSKDPAPVKDPEIISKVLTESLEFPWDIAWGSDNNIWMTERGGQISRVDPSNGNVTPLLAVNDVVSNGEGGLLGLALHPDLANTPNIFVSYCYDKAGVYTEKIVKYTIAGSTLVNPVILLDDIKAANIHNGSRLLISGDKLFISTGDASDQSLPQNFSSVNGKILRINLDGSIPADNPNPSSPVWSIGHRNAQGLTLVGDSLVASEHGPDSDDEINTISRGGNYGWPNVKGPCNTSEEQTFCNANNVINPLTSWTPTIAVSGMEYYNNPFFPQWMNSLLVCTLKGSKLVQLKLSLGSAPAVVSSMDYFTNTYGRLRDVCIAPNGKVYICTSNGDNDKIIEVSKDEN